MTIVETRSITGGVDTHLDTHVAAALDPIGGCWVWSLSKRLLRAIENCSSGCRASVT